jgi:hypothetical protein
MPLASPGCAASFKATSRAFQSPFGGTGVSRQVDSAAQVPVGA